MKLLDFYFDGTGTTKYLVSSLCNAGTSTKSSFKYIVNVMLLYLHELIIFK